MLCARDRICVLCKWTELGCVQGTQVCEWLCVFIDSVRTVPTDRTVCCAQNYAFRKGQTCACFVHIDRTKVFARERNTVGMSCHVS